MIGAVGDDEFGPHLIQRLRDNGVDVSGIRTVKETSTGVCVAIVELGSGENRLLSAPGANISLLPDDFPTFGALADGPKPDLLISQLELRLDTVEKIISLAAGDGIDVLLNAAPAKILPDELYKLITHLVVNETEAAILSGRGMDEMMTPSTWSEVTDLFLRKGAKNIVITLGDKGAYYSSAVGCGGYVPALHDFEIVDTTGAG